VKWLGHACFLLVSPKGIRVVTDPFGPQVPYPPINESCDVVTISHEHFDHNYVSVLKGDFQVLHGVDPNTKKAQKIETTIGDVSFRTVATFHDNENGKKRGENAIFIMDFSGLTVVHLGDLGHELDKNVIKEIGPVDVLCVPVGGYFTIDAAKAKNVVRSVAPKVVVPMHYKTKYTKSWSIARVDEFLKGEQNVVKLGRNEVLLEKSKLPKDREIWVFEI